MTVRFRPPAPKKDRMVYPVFFDFKEESNQGVWENE